MTSLPLTVDATDPLVALLAWLLTSLVAKVGGKRTRQVKHLLPAVAVLSAVALRAGVSAVEDAPVSVDTALRAVAAGGVAVLTHSQAREIQKMRAPRGGSADKTVPSVRRDTVPPMPPGEGA